jgi:hypothetical protein
MSTFAGPAGRFAAAPAVTGGGAGSVVGATGDAAGAPGLAAVSGVGGLLNGRDGVPTVWSAP